MDTRGCDVSTQHGPTNTPTAFPPQSSQSRPPYSDDLVVSYLPAASLVENKRNARTHSKAQVRKIAESIKAFGFTNPILIDVNGMIVAGHGRVAAAKLLRMDRLPTIQLEKLTPAQVRAYVLADNRLSLDAGWDEDILRIELQNIVLEGEINVSLTGFEVPEIDILFGDAVEVDPADEIPEESADVVSKPGDLWLLGSHRVFCGDARSPAAYGSLMGGKRAAAVFADPPFNVRIQGHASGNGKVQHPEFAMASGEMSETEFTEFLTAVFMRLASFSTDGSVHYLCADWRHLAEMTSAGRQVYDSLQNLCVWDKGVGAMGSWYRSQHELIFVFRNGKAQHRNNVQLGKFGRNRTNVWQYPGANSLSRSGEEGNLVAMHPTVKPIAMVADAILDCTARGEIVLDSFLGSGSTLLAAERVGRLCCGMEIEPRYVDLAIRRWQQMTGEEAVHAHTMATFNSFKVEGDTDERAR